MAQKGRSWLESPGPFSCPHLCPALSSTCRKHLALPVGWLMDQCAVLTTWSKYGICFSLCFHNLLKIALKVCLSGCKNKNKKAAPLFDTLSCLSPLFYMLSVCLPSSGSSLKHSWKSGISPEGIAALLPSSFPRKLGIWDSAWRSLTPALQAEGVCAQRLQTQHCPLSPLFIIIIVQAQWSGIL